MTTEIYVEAFNPERREALLSDGTILPILGFFDEDEDETDDFEETEAFLTGSGEMGFFVFIDEFDPPIIQ